VKKTKIPFRLSTMVADIRKDYQYKLKFGKDAFVRQLGTCAYFIDRLALRVGGEKNTDEEADTVGCTSLRVEHVRVGGR
jgi:DNA topoisomerase I